MHSACDMRCNAAKWNAFPRESQSNVKYVNACSALANHNACDANACMGNAPCMLVWC